MSALPVLGFLAGAPGPFELLVLFAVVLLLFGSRQLPEIARTIGSVLTEFRRASRDFQDQIMKEVDDVEVSPPVTPSRPAAADPAPEPPDEIRGGMQFPRGAPTEFEDDAPVDDEAPEAEEAEGASEEDRRP